jgi:hypothetical protein
MMGRGRGRDAEFERLLAKIMGLPCVPEAGSGYGSEYYDRSRGQIQSPRFPGLKDRKTVEGICGWLGEFSGSAGLILGIRGSDFAAAKFILARGRALALAR